MSAPLHFAVLASDVLLLSLQDGRLHTLLVHVHRPRVGGELGFPGGLIRPDETAEDSAARQLVEKGGFTGNAHLEQLATFSGIDRDPRGRVVSVAYLGLTADTEIKGKTSYEPVWHPVRGLKGLAYDHDAMLATALERLRAKIGYTTLISRLMPATFTLTQLQSAYETILGHPLDKRNFRKKLLERKVVKGTGESAAQGAHRPAELYRFTAKTVQPIEIL